MPSIKDDLTVQELAVYLTLKAKKNKEGVKTSELREAHPDINPTRLGDLLRILINKGAVDKLGYATYQVTKTK